MNNPDKVQVSDKVKLPIDWMMVLILSSCAAFVCFFIGAVAHIRSLLYLFDFLVIGVFLLAGTMGVVSVINLFSSKSK
jgi:uncharacterized MAPEG superfamily protein